MLSVIPYEDKIVYGVWADVLVGNMIVGEQLKISNKNGSVNLTGDGIEINNGKIHLSNDEYSIEIDPEHSSKNLFCIKDIKTNEIVMGYTPVSSSYCRNNIPLSSLTTDWLVPDLM